MLQSITAINPLVSLKEKTSKDGTLGSFLQRSREKLAVFRIDELLANVSRSIGSEPASLSVLGPKWEH